MSYVNGHTHVDMSEITPVAGRVCVGVGFIERIRTNRKKDVFGKENNSVFAHGYVAFLHAHVSWPVHLSYFRFHIKYTKKSNSSPSKHPIPLHLCTSTPGGHLSCFQLAPHVARTFSVVCTATFQA